MPAEINGNHAVAQLERGRVYLRETEEYVGCGRIVITPFFVFISGHGGPQVDYAPLVSVAVPREDVRMVVDHSVEACETHDEMDAEAEAQMESLQNAEESKED